MKMSIIFVCSRSYLQIATVTMELTVVGMSRVPCPTLPVAGGPATSLPRAHGRTWGTTRTLNMDAGEDLD